MNPVLVVLLVAWIVVAVGVVCLAWADAFKADLRFEATDDLAAKRKANNAQHTEHGRKA